jgi:murein DD-endopeptidase
VVVSGSLAAALTPALGDEGSQVAAHYARIFMWDLDLRRDVVAGDRMTVIWRTGAGGDPEIGAAAYSSQRLGRTLRAYRFRNPGDGYDSYWSETGQEVARRLKASPLRDYEQITALLKDRPTHKGMDFKTPVGTPVVAPRAGVVARIDWKLSGNGHCLDLRLDDGMNAKFLHLSAVKVARGARVQAGQVVALTGNTGHSTAPHLHYQLDRGGKILDPIDVHGTTRRQLGAGAKGAFGAAVGKLEQSCGKLP